jgi:hypothetical protein
MLNKRQKDERSVATDDDSSTEAGIKIVFINRHNETRIRSLKTLFHHAGVTG